MSPKQPPAAIRREEWLQALAEVDLPTESDEQAMTVREFMDLFGLTRPAAEKRLMKLVEKGKATRTHKRTARQDGRMSYLVAYRLV